MGLGLNKLIDQEEKSLEKYEDFPELSIEQFLIKSSPVSLGQIMRDVWKTKREFVSSKVS